MLVAFALVAATLGWLEKDFFAWRSHLPLPKGKTTLAPSWESVFIGFIVSTILTLIWIALRRRANVAIRPPAEYADADDALAAAFQLDVQGDWEAAIALYGEVARRWPEHAHYARECIAHIEEKRSRG
jgi:hypothetical protein